MSSVQPGEGDLSRQDIRKLFGATLVGVGRVNPAVVLLDCEVATVTGAIAFERAFPDRFIEMGIAEQNAVSFAAGLARMGLVPVVALFACFSARRALDQVSVQVAYGRFNVKVCGLYAGLTSPNTGATHQMIQDVAIMRSMPNMAVVEPADNLELVQALPAVVDHPGPVYFRLARGDIGGPCPRVSPDGYQFRLGRASLLRDGRDVTLVGSGLMVSRCLQAAERLAADGVSADVINVSTLKPLDAALIAKRACRTGAVVTAENHTVIGGLGSAVAEVVSETCPVPMRRVGVPDRFGESAPLEDLFPHYGLTTDAIVKAVGDVLGARGLRA